MLIEGHLYGAVQFSVLKWFDYISKGLCYLCPLQGLLVCVCSEIYDRDIGNGAYLAGSINAVHFLPQYYIHQDQIRPDLLRLPDRFLS